MLVGIFSDVHDNLSNLEIALDYFSKTNIKELIFCGDFCSPVPIRKIGNYKGIVHSVFGNGDGDRFAISNIVRNECENIVLYGEHAEIEISERKIAITHYPLYGRALARTGDYDAVFSGHTHEFSTENIGNCVWGNPGEILGAFGDATCGIYDTELNTFKIVNLNMKN